MKPTIGRIVIFNDGQTASQEFPAVIMRVHSDTVINVEIFRDDGGQRIFRSVPQQGTAPGNMPTWSWPTRNS